MCKRIGRPRIHLECLRIQAPDRDVAEHSPVRAEAECVSDATGHQVVDPTWYQSLHERLCADAADNNAPHEAEIEQRRRGSAAAGFTANVAVVAPERAKGEAALGSHHVLAKVWPDRTRTRAPTSTSAMATMRVRKAAGTAWATRVPTADPMATPMLSSAPRRQSRLPVQAFPAVAVNATGIWIAWLSPTDVS